MVRSITQKALGALVALLALTAASAWAEDRTVGVIMTGDITYYKEIHQAFSDAMGKKAGIKIVLQAPAPDAMSWTNSARKLVAIGSSAIVTYGAPATLTAMKETSSIPIVFAGVYDPEAMGVSGKNATGISSKVSIEQVVKGLKAIKPFTSLGVVFNKAEKDTILQVKEVKSLEGGMGFTSKLFNSEQEGFAAGIEGVDAILLTTSCTGMCGVADVIGLARKNKIPTAATIGGGKGVLYSVSAAPEEQGKAVAEMVDKVLGGAAPSSLAIKEPTKFEITVNTQEAGAIGVSIPKDILSTATEVIK